MSTGPADVIVVGGGVVGAGYSPYYLSKAGLRVTILERGGFGAGCSHANCGFICPSHVLPLATPGGISDALRSLLQRNSPFKIKPRLDVALWKWLWRFARRCNQRDMLTAGQAIHALLQSSRTLYDELMAAEPFECEWHHRGMLFVLKTHEGMEHFAHTDDILREHFGLGATRLDGEAVRQREPALKPELAGGFYYPAEAHLRPDRLMKSWKRILEGRGVTIHEHCEVREFVGAHRRAHTVGTAQGPMSAEAFVIATGAWTPWLNRHLGCAVPIQPGKGYSMTMRRPAKCPTLPLLFEEHRVAVTPMDSGYRLGSTMEFAGYDATLNRSRLELLRAGASHYLEEPYAEPVEEEWFGWRPMTPDSVPIIGPCPAFANVILAAGHNMLGLSMSPGTGKLVTELLTEQPPHVDPTPYRVERFHS